MQFQLYILFAIVFTITSTRRVRNVPKSEEAQLEKEHRNAICCQKKMRCCVKPDPSPIEIRAMIARCPNMGTDTQSIITRTLKKPVLNENEHNIKSFQGFDEDEPLIQSKVLNCRRKVLLTIKLHHKGKLNNCKNQYIVIDHVYDPLTEKSVRLLNPYVIKMKQEPVLKSYLLKFVDYVNSEAREVVYNKHDGNFTGCHTTRSHSTCGVVKFDGRIIPYSEGFCCSCDAKKNAERQPDSINEKNEAIISYSDPVYLLDRVECPRNFYKDKEELEFDEKEAEVSKYEGGKRSTGATAPSMNIEQKRELPMKTSPNPNNAHKYLGKAKREDAQCAFKNKNPIDVNEASEAYLKRLDLAAKKKQPDIYIDDVKRQHNPLSLQEHFQRLNEKLGDDEFSRRILRKIRQTNPSGVQMRGGQNCADRYTPIGRNPENYHESAHCLRFSDVWYGIYKLGEPFVEQTIALNIYERFETEQSSDKWREITNGTLFISTRHPTWEDETPTISVTLTTKSMSKCKVSRLHTRRILIPEGVKNSEMQKHPEMKNGPPEYLVVKPDQVALEGDQCDKVGVGFEAFYKQPKRCSVPRNTCLRNQPKHLWQHDNNLAKRNVIGCYFLKYHANLTSDPIATNETTGEKYLSVEFTGSHIATIDIEIKADYNAIIRKQTTAVITEVYVDSTCEKITTIIIKVINSSLISAKYMVQLSDFPLEIPEYFSKIKSKMTLIPPQNQHIFNLQIRFRLPSDLMFCSVEVLNENHELVALRRVRIQKFDRCICTWHCLCACVASSDGLKCNPMSLEHYHAAGFQGSLPIVTYMVHFTMLDDLLSVSFYFSLFLLTILLVLGLGKALFGICLRSVGMWGLAVLLDLPKPMKHYYELSLKDEPVIYDGNGWPVHPKTKEQVRNISFATEFCTNVVFFFTYPLGCCIVILRRLCCPHYTKKNEAKSAPSQSSNQSGGKKVRHQEPDKPSKFSLNKYIKDRCCVTSDDDDTSKSTGRSKNTEEKNRKLGGCLPICGRRGRRGRPSTASKSDTDTTSKSRSRSMSRSMSKPSSSTATPKWKAKRKSTQRSERPQPAPSSTSTKSNFKTHYVTTSQSPFIQMEDLDRFQSKSMAKFIRPKSM